jgi:hypothetical protein
MEAEDMIAEAQRFRMIVKGVTLVAVEFRDGCIRNCLGRP